MFHITIINSIELPLKDWVPDTKRTDNVRWKIFALKTPCHNSKKVPGIKKDFKPNFFKNENNELLFKIIRTWVSETQSLDGFTLVINQSIFTKKYRNPSDIITRLSFIIGEDVRKM